MRTVCVWSTLTFKDDTLLKERESCTPRKDGMARGGKQRTWRIPVCSPAWGEGSPIPPSPLGQKGEWVRGAGPGGGGSHLAVDQKSWPLCLAGLPPGLLAVDRGWHQGMLPLRPARVPLHQAPLDHAVRLLLPSQNVQMLSSLTLQIAAVLPCPAPLLSLLGVRRGESFPKDPSSR